MEHCAREKTFRRLGYHLTLEEALAAYLTALNALWLFALEQDYHAKGARAWLRRRFRAGEHRPDVGEVELEVTFLLRAAIPSFECRDGAPLLSYCMRSLMRGLDEWWSGELLPVKVLPVKQARAPRENGRARVGLEAMDEEQESGAKWA